MIGSPYVVARVQPLAYQPGYFLNPVIKNKIRNKSRGVDLPYRGTGRLYSETNIERDLLLYL
jgi:hypothetical protein